MHSYLRAIGFSQIEKNPDVNLLLAETIKNYDSKKIIRMEKERRFAEFTKEFIPGGGLCVCGEYVENNDLHIEYYFPYLTGSETSSNEDVIIEKHADKESYMGACDDLRLDISLVFHLINSADYLNSLKKTYPDIKTSSVSLSALSNEGKILLPVSREKTYALEKQKAVQKRSALMSAARNGDESAMESLTVEEMDVYNEIAKRAKNEDLYTIIDNCFMPYGFGSDMYSIIGDICSCAKTRNYRTGENIVKMGLQCSGIPLDLCINEKDLLGAPEIGRRFKGIIWLQGSVEF